MRDAPSNNTSLRACTDLEYAFDDLLRVMNLWGFAPAGCPALTLALSVHIKVGSELFSQFAALGSRALGISISAVPTLSPSSMMYCMSSVGMASTEPIWLI